MALFVSLCLLSFWLTVPPSHMALGTPTRTGCLDPSPSGASSTCKESKPCLCFSVQTGSPACHCVLEGQGLLLVSVCSYPTACYAEMPTPSLSCTDCLHDGVAPSNSSTACAAAFPHKHSLSAMSICLTSSRGNRHHVTHCSKAALAYSLLGSANKGSVSCWGGAHTHILMLICTL